MSGNKTEKPTPKRLKDSAKKGQSFKSKDFVISCLIILSVEYIVSGGSIKELMAVWPNIIQQEFSQGIHDYSVMVFWIGIKSFLPLLLLCIVASSLPALLQTGFVLATKALKLNFDALNPVNGIKKLFSLRSLKDFIKTILYFMCFVAALLVVWQQKKELLFEQLHGDAWGLVLVWGELLRLLVLTSLICILVILVLDALAEYFLHIKDLKMEKHEVQKEHKEQDGNPEIKSKRREFAHELLSEQVASDVKKSKVIIANPTHIAIGIYFEPSIAPIPFISVMETNQRALAVRRYAEKEGVPVVEDISLARRIFKTHSRYSFIKLDEIDEVLKILIWLEQVENAWRDEIPTSNEGKQFDVGDS